MTTLLTATTEADYRDALVLIRAYEDWLGMDLAFQEFEEELAALPAMYGPPKGAMILAREGETPIGCVGLRELSRDCCEMKRMFLLPEHQGRGIGSRLLRAFLDAAERLGYRKVRLDTLKRLGSALALYRKAGFREIGAYRFNPDPEAIYMELDLRRREGRSTPDLPGP